MVTKSGQERYVEILIKFRLVKGFISVRSLDFEVFRLEHVDRSIDERNKLSSDYFERSCDVTILTSCNLKNIVTFQQ